MEVAKRSYAHSMTIHCASFDGKLKPPRWWQLLPICSVLQCWTLEEVVLCIRTLCFCVLSLKGEHHRLWLELGRYLLQVLQVVSDIWIIREAYSTVQCHLHGLLKVYFNFFPKKGYFLSLRWNWRLLAASWRRRRIIKSCAILFPFQQKKPHQKILISRWDMLFAVN